MRIAGAMLHVLSSFDLHSVLQSGSFQRLPARSVHTGLCSVAVAPSEVPFRLWIWGGRRTSARGPAPPHGRGLRLEW